VCRHSRAVSPLLTCPAPRDCRLTLRICVACWVSDDLDAWPACARRTAVASVNVIVVVVLDRRPLWPSVLLFLLLHHTTTSPPATATRHHHSTPTNPTPSLIPLLLTGHADIASTATPYISRLLPSRTPEEQQELELLPRTKTRLVAVERESPWRIPTLQPTRPADHNSVTCATWTLAPPLLETV
jgi:hypothetical protein